MTKKRNTQPTDKIENSELRTLLDQITSEYDALRAIDLLNAEELGATVEIRSMSVRPHNGIIDVDAVITFDDEEPNVYEMNGQPGHVASVVCKGAHPEVLKARERERRLNNPTRDEKEADTLLLFVDTQDVAVLDEVVGDKAKVTRDANGDISVKLNTVISKSAFRKLTKSGTYHSGRREFTFNAEYIHTLVTAVYDIAGAHQRKSINHERVLQNRLKHGQPKKHKNVCKIQLLDKQRACVTGGRIFDICG